MVSVEPLPPVDLEIKLMLPLLEQFGLTINELNKLKKTNEYVTGDKKLRHFLLWSENINAHYILIIDNETNSLVGYTCQDLEGKYHPCKMISPYLEDDYAVDSDLIEDLLNLINKHEGDQNAYAVMESGECYIQTIREKDGFVLEYQAVAIAFHFKVPEKLSLEDVKKAFHSFNEGDDKWLTCLEWKHINIKS